VARRKPRHFRSAQALPRRAPPMPLARPTRQRAAAPGARWTPLAAAPAAASSRRAARAEPSLRAMTAATSNMRPRPNRRRGGATRPRQPPLPSFSLPEAQRRRRTLVCWRARRWQVARHRTAPPTAVAGGRSTEIPWSPRLRTIWCPRAPMPKTTPRAVPPQRLSTRRPTLRPAPPRSRAEGRSAVWPPPRLSTVRPPRATRMAPSRRLRENLPPRAARLEEARPLAS
jgi:hypothetical protein